MPRHRISTDIKVGDKVYVFTLGRKDPVISTVDKVGRKYFTVGNFQYDLKTGQWNDKDFGYERCAYTESQWERVKRERDFSEALKRFNSAVTRPDIATVSDSDLDAATDDLIALAKFFEFKAEQEAK